MRRESVAPKNAGTFGFARCPRLVALPTSFLEAQRRNAWNERGPVPDLLQVSFYVCQQWVKCAQTSITSFPQAPGWRTCTGLGPTRVLGSGGRHGDLRLNDGMSVAGVSGASCPFQLPFQDDMRNQRRGFDVGSRDELVDLQQGTRHGVVHVRSKFRNEVLHCGGVVVEISGLQRMNEAPS
eukprot:Skav225944  [mRNA]  locus=scaffold1500:538074:543350:+ [translate_table: standard]